MISIIGAGPTGSYLAYLLARKNLDVRVFEKEPFQKKTFACTGIISRNISNLIKLDQGLILNKIKGARIFSPNGNSLKIKTNKTQAFVIDRIKFDNFLIEKAKDAGAKFYFNHDFDDFKIKKDEMILNFKNKKKKIRTNYLVGADGPLSVVAKKSDLFGKREFLNGFQARVKLKTSPEIIQMYLGKQYKDFFAWVVPESGNIARIGLASKKNPRKAAEILIRKLKIRKQDIIDYQGGLIPIYNPRLKTQKNNIFLLGDSATQIKASTGGGIITGLMAAEELAKSIKKGKINYQRTWKKKIGKDLLLNLWIRKILDKFSDKEYNDLVDIMNKEKNKVFMQKSGSMDFPSNYIFRLMFKEPRLFKFLLKIF